MPVDKVEAIEQEDGTRYWYLNGLMYNEDEFQVEVGLQAWGLSTNAQWNE
mgnify:CR=1 FL=1